MSSAGRTSSTCHLIRNGHRPISVQDIISTENTVPCAAQKFDRSPAQRVRLKEEMQRNGRDLPLAAGRGIWSLHRRSGEAGQSRGVVRAPWQSHLPAVRAVSGIYGGVPKAAKNSPRALQNEKSPSFQGKRRGSDEKYEVNTEKW